MNGNSEIHRDRPKRLLVWRPATCEPTRDGRNGSVWRKAERAYDQNEEHMEAKSRMRDRMRATHHRWVIKDKENFIAI